MHVLHDVRDKERKKRIMEVKKKHEDEEEDGGSIDTEKEMVYGL